MVMREDALLGNRLAALLENTELLCHITKPADDLLIAIVEGKEGVWNASVATELGNVLLGTAKIVARHARVEVVDGLELQTTMEEVKPGRAVDVHGSTQHLLGKGLVNTQVGRGHSEMRQRDLDVQRRRDNMGDHDERKSAAPVWDGLVYHEVAVPVPEE